MSADQMITPQQLKLINVLCAKLKLNRDQAIGVCSRAACKPITSRNELTRLEAGWSIEALQTWLKTGVDMTATEHHPELAGGAA